GPKNLAHATLAELPLDTVWPQALAHSQFGERRTFDQVRRVLDGRPIQEFAASGLGEKRLYFAAQFGICLGQQCGALLSGSVASRMVELFNLLQSLRAHVPMVSLWLSSRNSQALAKSQSRLTVRGEIFRAATISSSVNPPKKRNSTTFACRGATSENAVRASSRARMDGSVALDRRAVSSRFTLIALPPRLSAP